MYIFAEIVSLRQHLQTIKIDLHRYTPDRCPHCGKAGLWRHGMYYRKPDRKPGGVLNPIPIPRFYCSHCSHTCSTLPECLPPKRWYPWLFQQTVIMLLLSGVSFKASVKKVNASRSTARRWWSRLKARYHQHRQALVSRYPELGRTGGFVMFWQTCLAQIPLSQAMLHVAQTGWEIP